MTWNVGWKDVDPKAEGAEYAPLESVIVSGVAVKTGDRVRLWPHKNADILDMALEGKLAVVEAIERDFEDRVHLAVVIEDDPGRDLGMLRQPGHRFFFSPEEVELVTADSAPGAPQDEVRDER